MNEEKELRAASSPEKREQQVKVVWELTEEGMLQKRRLEEPVSAEETAVPEPEAAVAVAEPPAPVPDEAPPTSVAEDALAVPATDEALPAPVAEEEQAVPEADEELPAPEEVPSVPVEAGAVPVQEETDTDDAEIWSNLPRPPRRRQPRVQATIVSTAPAGKRGSPQSGGSVQGKPARSGSPQRRKKSTALAAQKRTGGQKKTLLQRIQSLDLRLLLVILIVLIVIALIFGAILLRQGSVAAAITRGDSGFSKQDKSGSDDAWNYSQTAEDSDQSLPRYDGDSSGVVLELKSSQGLEPLTYEELYRKCAPWAVSITVKNADASGSGTGVVLTQDGYIITCAHVISDQSQATVTDGDGTEYSAQLVGSDPQTDLALLKIDAEGLTPAEFGDAGALTVGDEALAIGDPLGATFRGTLTNGIISAINRDVTLNGYAMTLIQTTAALNSGNSGGPLLNVYGQVVGINNMKMVSSSTTVEGLGFAVPSTTAKKIIEALAQDGGISRPVLGITCYGVDQETAETHNSKAGLVLAKVDERSDCAAKGLQVGDVITAIDGKAFTDVAAFKEYAADFSIGQKVTLTVYRPKEIKQEADASTSGAAAEPVEYEALGEITVSLIDQQKIS